MQRTYVFRSTLLFTACATWAFLLLSLASFHATDWPSHAVFREANAPVLNVCGPVGAYVAYYSFLAIGQGVFPILFFSGVCLALVMFRNRVSDLWLRVAGLTILTIAFAAAVHHIHPGSRSGFPEGNGGIFGIGAATFLQHHFNTVGTRLVLLTSFLIGLLLAADDLVLRAPGVVGNMVAEVKDRAPQMPAMVKLPNFKFPELPKLPALPNFRTKESVSKIAHPEDDEDEDSPLRLQPLIGRSKNEKPQSTVKKDRDATPLVVRDDDEIELTYPQDEPVAAQDAAFIDGADPGPSVLAIVPPLDEQAVPQPKPEVTIRKDIVVRLPNTVKPRQIAPPPPKELGEYTLPNWEILDEADHSYAESQEEFVRAKAAILEQALKEYRIEAQVVEIDTGPVITMYEISLAPGVKVSAITALSNDIMRALKAESVRIVAPVPGKSTVGIEVPNDVKEKVRMKELMQLTPTEEIKEGDIPIFLGKDASGEPLIAKLNQMPHCLIAGTTGSGKSVCINSIIMSIMYTQRPDRVKLILVDPKVVEMAPFKEIPHLMCPVINDAAKATSVLEWACQKMDERYDLLAEAGVRNLKGYNSLTQEELIERFKPGTPEEEAKIPKKLPYIVIIVDELADLMMTSGKEVEASIVRLAQKARAVGIHLVLATQRPQATVVTGLIKANMPSKIAFRVSSKMDSRIVLDMNGAEVLLGQGDMLYMPPGASKPIRGQGTYIDDHEIRDSVKLVKGLAEAQYEPELVQIKATGSIDDEAAKDDLFEDAVRVVLETRRGSVSLLQRRLTIGYSRASRLIEAMAAAGIVGDYKGSQAREATITIEEWEAMKGAQQTDAENGMSV